MERYAGRACRVRCTLPGAGVRRRSHHSGDRWRLREVVVRRGAARAQRRPRRWRVSWETSAGASLAPRNGGVCWPASMASRCCGRTIPAGACVGLFARRDCSRGLSGCALAAEESPPSSPRCCYQVALVVRGLLRRASITGHSAGAHARWLGFGPQQESHACAPPALPARGGRVARGREQVTVGVAAGLLAA